MIIRSCTNNLSIIAFLKNFKKYVLFLTFDIHSPGKDLNQNMSKGMFLKLYLKRLFLNTNSFFVWTSNGFLVM